MTELPSTKDVITAMLKENTGTHFLDSGGAYGRSWQQNQSIDFDQTSPSKVEFDLENGWITVTKSIYHWLLDQLEITELSQRYYEQFIAFSELDANKDMYWSELYEAFVEHLNETDYPAMLIDKRTEGWKIDGGGNSYNHESSLSQVYQYDVLKNDDKDIRIIILQIHGGCDVRGGYTAPKFFQSAECEEDCFGYNDNDYSIDLGKHYFSTDDAYHWYCDGCCNSNTGKNDIITMLRESVVKGDVPGVEPDETCFTLESDCLHSLYIEYKHKSDNCRTLDEFGVQS